MRSEVSRTYEMGTRVVGFDDTQPDTDEGHVLSATKVKDVVTQMRDVAAVQRAGLVDKGAAAAEKARLRREILAGPVAHLAEVGKRASRSGFELGRTYRYKPGTQTYTSFLTAARGMQTRALADAKVLLKFGLSESVLAEMGELLDKFEAAVALGNDGRTRHMGATKQLERLAVELGSLVRTMDARNRQRFQDNPQLLASWISASAVLGTKRTIGVPAEVPGPGTEPGGPEAGTGEGGTPVVEGDVRPAA